MIAGMRELFARDIPAILVTGDTSTAMRKLPSDGRLRSAGKPIDAEDLLTLMDELLHTQQPS